MEACGAKEFYKTNWEWVMKTFPVFASRSGWGEDHSKFSPKTVEFYKSLHENDKKILAAVRSFLADPTCESEKVNLELLEYSLKSRIDGHKYESYLVQFQSMGGPHTWLPQLHNNVPLKTKRNFQDYLKRLEQIPEQFMQARTLSLLGVEKGITPPQVTFKNYESSMLDLSKGPAEKSPYYKPFLKMPEAISLADQKALQNRARQIIKNNIHPAYVDLHKFWVKDYYPKLRKTISAGDLPNGKDFYNYQVKNMTTLDKTAKEIHEIGLSEVKRILGEMTVIKNKVKFKGSLRGFFKHLRTHPKFYAKTPEELFNKAAVILKEIDGKLPKLFKHLPRLTYGLEPTPAYIAKKSPAAYYISGSSKNGKSGTYQLNLSNLKSRPLYNLMALSLHEAVPGHHLQIALAQELEGLPEFRKTMNQTAFTEGWGLYSEALGKMVGMYTDPYDDFGRLNYEQWRAMRLVVDTGIHAFGWSRQKAIEFMKSNSGLSEKNIITEVDRYINWPGQALAYKMGELKIKELRERAKRELGAKYDIRDFHYEVLKEGAIPLPVLEKNIERYIKKMK